MGPESNNAAYEVKRKKGEKNFIISHTQHRPPPILTPISIIGKKWGHEKEKGALQRSNKKQERVKYVKFLHQYYAECMFLIPLW